MQSSNRPMNLALNLVTADDVQIPSVDPRPRGICHATEKEPMSWSMQLPY